MLNLIKAKLGPEHPNTLHVMNNVARAYQAVGRANEALPIFREAADVARRNLGMDHPKTQLFNINRRL
jgi:eukaryotic-like serine/threonine-protein kinase